MIKNWKEAKFTINVALSANDIQEFLLSMGAEEAAEVIIEVIENNSNILNAVKSHFDQE